MRDLSGNDVGVIYGIRHVADPNICYVGQTRQKPRKRWAEHKRGDTPISKAMRMLGLSDWEFIVLEWTEEATLNEREQFWITKLGTLHPNGLNLMSGGHVTRASQATRGRLAEQNKLRWADPEYKDRVRATLKEVRSRPGYKSQQAASVSSLWDDPDFRARQSASRQAMWDDPERRARKIAAGRATRKRNAEQRAINAG